MQHGVSSAELTTNPRHRNPRNILDSHPGKWTLRHLPTMNPILLKCLHLAGVFALFASLGATMLSGSGKKGSAALHGISLVLILLIGFAMLKKPPMNEYWWMAKLGIWLFIGAAPAIAKRKIIPAPAVLALCLAAAACSGWLALAKPF